MSSSRQKSCLACVRSKRRCDQGFPKCRRCRERKIDCDFPGRIFDRNSETARDQWDQDAGFAESFAEEALSYSDQHRSAALTALRPTPSVDNAFLQFGNDPFNLPEMAAGDLFHPAVIGDIMAQRTSPEPGQITSDARLQARVEFAAKRLAAIPKTFAEQAQTMFIHRRLFQERKPPALQDALSVCALYCIKNADNQEFIFHSVKQKSQQLITSTDPFLVSRMDLLAALQALLLYQTIRLFDGDIHLRAQAEADEAILIMWAEQLRSSTLHLAPLSPPSAGTSLAPQGRTSDWPRWLAQESSRRTVITTLMLKGVYSFLKLSYDRPQDLRLSFTAQAALWNAQSEYGWQMAYSEREPLEVRITHWDEDMAKATPSDLDELGALLMAMLWGVEPTMRWLGTGYLARYGLEGVKDDSLYM